MNTEVGQPSVAAMEVGTEADPTLELKLLLVRHDEEPKRICQKKLKKWVMPAPIRRWP